MANSVNVTALALAAAVVAGCTMNTGGSGASGGSSGSTGSAGSGTSNVAEQACLRDVRQSTNNPQVVVLSSQPYQGGGTYVTVGVGPTRAPWQCIGYGNGTTTEIMSLVDEGRL